MPVRSQDPMDRLVCTYDTDRLDFIHASPFPRPELRSLSFSGGPLDGRSRPFRIPPDEMSIEGVDGFRYLPNVTGNTYCWMPIPDDTLPKTLPGDSE